MLLKQLLSVQYVIYAMLVCRTIQWLLPGNAHSVTDGPMILWRTLMLLQRIAILDIGRVVLRKSFEDLLVVSLDDSNSVHGLKLL